MQNKKIIPELSKATADETEPQVDDPQRREALSRLVKYTPPAMITLLANDSAWAQISGGPPPPPSDIRLKTDIDCVGATRDGHKLYSFRYQDDVARIRYVGLMAQEILKSNPAAVATRPDGYYAVHYESLGLKMATYDQWKRQGIKSVQ